MNYLAKRKMAKSKLRNNQSQLEEKGFGLGSTSLIRGVPDGATWNVLSQSYPNSKVPTGNSCINVVKTIDLGTVLTLSDTVGVGEGINFTLSELPESSSYTTIFDQYRVKDIEIWLIPEQNSVAAADNMYASCIDYDDSTAPTSLGQVLDYDTSLLTSVACGQYRRLKPRVAVAAYAGTFASFKNEMADWIDCASNGVQHYGVKVFAETTVSALNNAVIRGILRVHLQFRGTR
jgi:hypothetical protein